MKTIKVFHALPMSGYTDEEIKSRLESEDSEIRMLIGSDVNVEIIHPHMDPITDENLLKELKTENLYYFGLSLSEGISKADIVIFGYDWWKARGCQVEEFICQLYGIPYVELNDIESSIKLKSLINQIS